MDAGGGPGAIGPYRILGEVGRGGMGLVLRGLDPAGAPVALKLLLSGAGASEVQRRRFAQEARALARLRHPGLVTLLASGEHRGVPWLAMEWVEGESLEARLRREGPLDPRAAAELVRRLALAVEHCHRQGLLHRDIKPGNVLLRARTGEPLLTDLGLARDQGDCSRSALTRTGQLLGSPGYWSPEQAERPDAVGARSDVYGLGALLHAALTGHPPVEGASLQEQVEALTRPPRPPSRLRPGIPRELETICLRALARDPADRPPSAAALAADLGAWLSKGTAPRPGSTRLVPLGTALALACAAAAALLVLRPPPDRGPSPPVPPGLAPRTACGHDPAGEEAEVAALVSQALTRAAGDAGVLERELTALLARFPTSTGLRFELGSLRARTGDHRAALADLDAVLERDPAHARALVNRAAVQRALGDVQAALADVERALALEPDEPMALVNRGSLRADLGDRAGARSDYDRALGRDPGLVIGLTNRGALRLELGDLPGGVSDLERALALAPEDAAALGNRASARLRLRDWAGAVQDAEAALRTAPRSYLARFTRGMARMELGDLAGALSDLDAAAAISPGDALVRRECAQVRVRQGDLPGALADLDRALVLDPRCLEALTDRGTVRAQLGDQRGALSDFDAAQALAPADALVLYNRAVCRAGLQDFAGAASDCDRILGAIPAHAEALYTRSYARSQLGDLAGAAADLEALLLVAPEHRLAPDARDELPRLRAALAAR